MKTPKILKTIHRDNICYFKSDINYTLLLLESGQKIISGYNIKVFEELYADYNFIKINRSNFVNVSFIKKVNNNNVCSILLTNGDEMPVSRRRLNKLKENYPLLF